MKPEELEATLKSYFESYPGENELLITSDGQVFLRKNANDAHNHQLRIDDKQQVKTYHRDEPADEDVSSGDPTLTPDESWTKEKIVEWLTVAGVDADIKEKKDELLEKVKLVGEEEEDDAGAGGTPPTDDEGQE